jgi:hypothetical protein
MEKQSGTMMAPPTREGVDWTQFEMIEGESLGTKLLSLPPLIKLPDTARIASAKNPSKIHAIARANVGAFFGTSSVAGDRRCFRPCRSSGGRSNATPRPPGWLVANVLPIHFAKLHEFRPCTCLLNLGRLTTSIMRTVDLIAFGRGRLWTHVGLTPARGSIY